MLESVRKFLESDDGEDLIEYGYLAAFISIAAILALRVIGPILQEFYQSIVNALTAKA
jgi:Flp pilus assembly pilin Flp